MELALMNSVSTRDGTRHSDTSFWCSHALAFQHAFPHVEREVAREAVFLEFGRHPTQSVELSGKDFPVNRDHSGFVRCRSESDDFFEFHTMRFAVSVRKFLGHLISLYLATVTAYMQQIIGKVLGVKVKRGDGCVLTDQGAQVLSVSCKEFAQPVCLFIREEEG